MRADDEAVFEAFVAARSDDLLRTAVLLTRDRGHAEDLVQTALVKAYRRRGRIEGADPYPYVRACSSPARPAGVAVADPRGLLGVVDAEELQWTVQSLLAHYGLPAHQLRPTLLAAGPVSSGSSTSVLLVGITFPSGATTAHLTTTWGVDEPSMTSTSRIDPAPSGTTLLDRLIALATNNAVTVSGPFSGVTAELYRDDGTLLTTVPLVDGAGSAPLAPPSRPYERVLMTVRVLDASGNVLGESTVEQQG